MIRKAVTPLYRGKLAILFLILAFSNLGVDDSGWMTVAEAGCEACENVQEEITFTPAYLELLEGESKTTTAAFTGGPANWSMPGPNGNILEWRSISFASSSTGVSTTTIRAQAGNRIPVDWDFPGRRTWVATPVTAAPLDTLVATTHRYLTVYGLGSSLNAPRSFPIVEGEARTIRVAVNNAPPSSTWKFEVAIVPAGTNMIKVEGIAPTSGQSAAITIRASELTGCNKIGFCTRYVTMEVEAERQSDQHRIGADVDVRVYFKD
jgi:hypothetical protein